jgi:hypothetical protein
MPHPLDLRVVPARPIADRPVHARPAREPLALPVAPPAPAPRRAPHGAPRTPGGYPHAGDLAALAARAAAWRLELGASTSASAPADVELSVRVLADGGTIAVARQVVGGRTRHIEAVVR